MGVTATFISKEDELKLRLCSCPLQNKAKNYCTMESCPQHESQFEFCEDCNTKVNHDHRPDRIHVLCNTEDHEWNMLLVQVRKMMDQTSSLLKKHNIIPLCEYFESVADEFKLSNEQGLKRNLDEVT